MGGNRGPAAMAMAGDVVNELLVFFGSPRAFLQHRMVVVVLLLLVMMMVRKRITQTFALD